MDKNAIKKYAVWARKELISRVAQKAQQYGITETEMVDAGAIASTAKCCLQKRCSSAGH